MIMKNEKTSTLIPINHMQSSLEKNSLVNVEKAAEISTNNSFKEVEKLLIIKWPYSREAIHIQLGKKPRENEITKTNELWKNPDIYVTYNTTSTRVINDDGSQCITIKYDVNNNSNLLSEIDPSNNIKLTDISWGETTIKIDKKLMSATAVWSQDSTNPRPCELSSSPSTTDRKLMDVSRVERDRAFRSKLLLVYGKCAITNESTTESLDAAHIVEVRDNGSDDINNGIMLRADIHRLYDARLLEINPENGVIEISEGLSEVYKNSLKNKSIDRDILKRISNSLMQRNIFRNN